MTCGKQCSTCNVYKTGVEDTQGIRTMLTAQGGPLQPGYGLFRLPSHSLTQRLAGGRRRRHQNLNVLKYCRGTGGAEADRTAV